MSSPIILCNHPLPFACPRLFTRTDAASYISLVAVDLLNTRPAVAPSGGVVRMDLLHRMSFLFLLHLLYVVVGAPVAIGNIEGGGVGRVNVGGAEVLADSAGYPNGAEGGLVNIGSGSGNSPPPDADHIPSADANHSQSLDRHISAVSDPAHSPDTPPPWPGRQCVGVPTSRSWKKS